MTAHDGLGSVRADARKATTEAHWDPATARLIDTAVAERDAWWRGQVEALAPAVLCAHEHPAEFAAMWDELMDELGQWRRGELSVPQPETTPERCGDFPPAMAASVRLTIGAQYHRCRLAPGHDGLHVNDGETWAAQPVPAPSDAPRVLARRMATEQVLVEVKGERLRQEAKWGEQNHPNGTGDIWEFCSGQHTGWAKDAADDARRRCQEASTKPWGDTYALILNEEVAEAFAEDDPALVREELIQVAAVAVAWVEAIDRRAGAR